MSFMRGFFTPKKIYRTINPCNEYFIKLVEKKAGDKDAEFKLGKLYKDCVLFVLEHPLCYTPCEHYFEMIVAWNAGWTPYSMELHNHFLRIYEKKAREYVTENFMKKESKTI